MKNQSFPTGDQVLTDLGDEFVSAFVQSVDGARDDFEAFRTWQPGWVAGFAGRSTADFIHERIWGRFVLAVDGMDDCTVIDADPVRQIHYGTRYVIRVKRHREGDRIAAYPTAAARSFWGAPAATLDGMESHSLALGYVWDADTRTVGNARMSYRHGTEKAKWAMDLRIDESTVAGFTWEHVDPELPDVDLSGIAGIAEEELGS